MYNGKYNIIIALAFGSAKVNKHGKRYEEYRQEDTD